MATGDVLRRLIGSYSRRDDETFQSAALALIDEERAKNHQLLARDLERLLYNGERAPDRQHPAVPKDKERGLPLLQIDHPQLDWERLITSPASRAELEKVVNENLRRELLASYGLQPSQRLLFFGPPGCGKTLAARLLASQLEAPLAVVRFDALVSSYLGETAANLRKVFDFVERGRWIVLFDEFDAIAKDRDNAQEHGELKRVVNTLLQLMDDFRGSSVMIAATNHEAMLDSAVWRRFELVIRFELPSPQERALLLRLFLRGMSSEATLDRIARDLVGFSGADIEQVAVDAARRAVLDGRASVGAKDLRESVTAFNRRLEAIDAALRVTASPAP